MDGIPRLIALLLHTDEKEQGAGIVGSPRRQKSWLLIVVSVCAAALSPCEPKLRRLARDIKRRALRHRNEAVSSRRAKTKTRAAGAGGRSTTNRISPTRCLADSSQESFLSLARKTTSPGIRKTPVTSQGAARTGNFLCAAAQVSNFEQTPAVSRRRVHS